MGPDISRRTVLGTAGAVGLTAAAASIAQPASAGQGGGLRISSEPFGTMPDGTPVKRFTFGSDSGVLAQMITYGATLTTLRAPDRLGHRDNVILGMATLDEYRALTTYFGATIGRYANRIAGGKFTLDGVTYQLPTNDNGNTLHGGPDGWDKKVWDATEVRTATAVGVKFSLVSPDGEMGFPGTVRASVTYTVTVANELVIHYVASTDKPTVINLTNHAYFNLAGEGSGDVFSHRMHLDADRYTPIDTVSIPLGPLPPVAGTPFDFRRPTPIGAHIRDGVEQIHNAKGYDHNWVLNGSGTRTFAVVSEPTTGRVLEAATDQPGVQLYTSNFLDASLIGVSGKVYRQGDGFTLETQHYPDSPNEPSYPSTVLRPGERYDSTTVFRFRTSI